MTSFPFRLVAPEAVLLAGEAEMVTLRSAGGDIAYLAGHVPYIGLVEPSVARIHLADAAVEVVAVHGGLVEVADGELVLLADEAERAGEIDVAQARAQRSAAEERLARAADDTQAGVDLRQALVRLEAAGAD